MPTEWYTNGTGNYYVAPNVNYTSNTVWTVWIDSGTGSTIANNVWQGWQDQTSTTLTIGNEVYGGYQPPQRTPEEIAAQAALAEQARQRWAEEQARLEAERAEASKRARVLLEENLSDEQRLQLRDNNWFEVVTPRGTYRIHNGRSGNVQRYRDGRPTDRYCIHPGELVPNEDTMLAQKLMLETDEDAFLRIANRSQPWQ